MRSLKLGSLVLVAVLALSAGACSNTNMNMVIMYAVAPDSDCIYNQQEVGGAGEIEFLADGLLDLGHPIYSLPDVVPDYHAVFQVHNYTLANGNTDLGRLNSRDVMLKAAEISYTWMRNEELLAGDAYQPLRDLEGEDVSLPLSGVVSAASGPDEPGVLLLPLSLFPRYLGGRLVTLSDFSNDLDNLSQLVLGVTVRVIGTTLGGTRVESAPMVYPIYFCFGCLTGGMCPDGVTPAPQCVTGQDRYNLEACPEDTGT